MMNRPFADYGMDYMMHGYGSLLLESYLGRRVFDVSGSSTY